jgi:protein-S-isoprenylcysteine O-methyltransferase Ste14
VLGAGFLLRSALYFWVLLPWFAFMRFGVVAREERYLRQKFGKAYAHYCDRIARWL